MTVGLPGKPAEEFARPAAADGRSPEEYLRELVECEVKTGQRPETRAERFARLRADIVAAGIPLLDPEELHREIRERRGSWSEDD
jgi:hypothetical protein